MLLTSKSYFYTHWFLFVINTSCGLAPLAGRLCLPSPIAPLSFPLNCSLFRTCAVSWLYCCYVHEQHLQREDQAYNRKLFCNYSFPYDKTEQKKLHPPSRHFSPSKRKTLQRCKLRQLFCILCRGENEEYNVYFYIYYIYKYLYINIL